MTPAILRAQIEVLEQLLRDLVDADARDLTEARIQELRRRLDEQERQP